MQLSEGLRLGTHRVDSNLPGGIVNKRNKILTPGGRRDVDGARHVGVDDGEEVRGRMGGKGGKRKMRCLPKLTTAARCPWRRRGWESDPVHDLFAKHGENGGRHHLSKSIVPQLKTILMAG